MRYVPCAKADKLTNTAPLVKVPVAYPVSLASVKLPSLFKSTSITRLPSTKPLNASDAVIDTAGVVSFVFAAIDALTVGAVVSTTTAELPARLLSADGTVVPVITLPAKSAGMLLPEAPRANEATVKSLDVSPVCIVYVPTSFVASVPSRVSTTGRSVAPVSNVTVIFEPTTNASLAVAVIFTVPPAL